MKRIVARTRQESVINGRIRVPGEWVMVSAINPVTMNEVKAIIDPAQVTAQTEKIADEIKEKEKPVTLKIQTKGNGTVTAEPGQDEYKPYSVVVLTATGEKDFAFVRWEGGLTGTDNPAKLEIVTALDVTAVFEKVKDDGGKGPKDDKAK